jgi:hypothetical protein
VALHEGLTVNGFNAAAAVSALLFGHLLVDTKVKNTPPCMFPWLLTVESIQGRAETT